MSKLMRLQIERAEETITVEDAAMIRIETYDSDTEGKKQETVAWLSPGEGGGIKTYLE